MWLPQVESPFFLFLFLVPLRLCCLSSGGGGNIFDRLTDSSQYTGAHKHRFDRSGKGKGLAGRDRVMKGSGYVSARTHEGRSYVGSTNTGTDEIFHDSSQFLMRR